VETTWAGAAAGELANEPQTTDGLDPSGRIVKAWVADIAAHIKSLDPAHMVLPFPFPTTQILRSHVPTSRRTQEKLTKMKKIKTK
jgi:hypothetical protein